ncbi:MAG: ribosome recycling factor [Patescibacteria group bacterium]|nr:ribosome recycling factor [Patescibacteria group bacterium]
MNPNITIQDVKTKLTGAITHFNDEIKKLRTGRAHPSMLDGVVVMAYGSAMPLNQVSNVTAPEAQLLQIMPFDPNNIQAISDAIRNDQGLGLNPSDDGRVVRIPIPPLTTERRQQIVKQLNEKIEETHIACRNIRHEALSQAKQSKSSKLISEDDYARLEKQIDELMAKTKQEVESTAKIKEQEIMTV